jgi:hypothetical protein
MSVNGPPWLSVRLGWAWVAVAGRSLALVRLPGTPSAVAAGWLYAAPGL